MKKIESSLLDFREYVFSLQERIEEALLKRGCKESLTSAKAKIAQHFSFEYFSDRAPQEGGVFDASEIVYVIEKREGLLDRDHYYRTMTGVFHLREEEVSSAHKERWSHFLAEVLFNTCCREPFLFSPSNNQLTFEDLKARVEMALHKSEPLSGDENCLIEGALLSYLGYLPRNKSWALTEKLAAYQESENALPESINVFEDEFKAIMVEADFFQTKEIRMLHRDSYVVDAQTYDRKKALYLSKLFKVEDCFRVSPQVRRLLEDSSVSNIEAFVDELLKPDRESLEREGRGQSGGKRDKLSRGGFFKGAHTRTMSLAEFQLGFNGGGSS
jgi:hypothetical protein